LGLSKDRPSIVQASESDSRLRRALRFRFASRFLRVGKAASHPRAARVVSHHLDGLFLLDPATIFRPLPIVGFTAFPSVAKRNSPRCTCYPSKLSLRRQLRLPERIPDFRGPASPPRPFPAAAFTANLASSPFALPSLRNRSFLLLFPRQPGPRGVSPSSGPLRVRPFPAERTRCSLGLGRLHESLRTRTNQRYVEDAPKSGFSA